MTPLYALMHRWASDPFFWGWSDCCLSLADWHLYLHGTDPAAHLRGTYDSPQSCQRRTGWFSDPVAVIDGCLDTVGGRDKTTSPLPGDIGVIRVPQGARVVPLGALWLGDCWGVRTEGGAIDSRKSMTVGPMVPADAIWSFGYAG